MRWPTAVTVLRTSMVVVVVVLTLVTTLLATGPFGLVVAADGLAALGLVIALAVTPGSSAERPVERQGGARAWLARTGLLRRAGPRPAVQASDFPAYAKISSDLGWAHVSRWHYDHGVRPLLARLAQSALAEHHRVDTAADPARAQRLVGDDIWPFVDPSRPPSFDSKTPGVGPRTLSRIVDRLEQL
jgi:hypothetical protein